MPEDRCKEATSAFMSIVKDPAKMLKEKEPKTKFIEKYIIIRAMDASSIWRMIEDGRYKESALICGLIIPLPWEDALYAVGTESADEYKVLRIRCSNHVLILLRNNIKT